MRDDHRGQDQQPGELVLLHLAHVERDAQPTEATRPAGQVVLGRGQDLDDGREAQRDDEHAVGVQVGDEPADDDAGEAGHEGRDGGTGEELPGVAEGPVDLDVEDAEDVHAQAPEAHDAEVGDAGEAQLQVQQQGQARDHDDLEEAGDEEGVEPVEVHAHTPSRLRSAAGRATSAG